MKKFSMPLEIGKCDDKFIDRSTIVYVWADVDMVSNEWAVQVGVVSGQAVFDYLRVRNTHVFVLCLWNSPYCHLLWHTVVVSLGWLWSGHLGLQLDDLFFYG